MRATRGIVLRLCLVFSLAAVMPASAVTHSVAACNGTADHTKVQTAVDAAGDGDTVVIPAGTCTFTNSVTWNNKNIVVKGAGEGVTTITSNNQEAFSISPTTKAGFRITGMTINSNNSGIFLLDGFGACSAVPGRFRIDHITTHITGGSSPRTVMVQGIVYGLIDHVSFNHTLGASIPVVVEAAMQSTCDNYPANPAGHVSFNLPLDLGGDTAVYVEDSTFTLPFGGYGAINDSTLGGRMVFRHNTFTGPFHLQTHATRGNGGGGERGGMKSEYYNNVHDGLDDPTYPGAANMRSGTGVSFNNTIKNNSGGGNFAGVALLIDSQRIPSASCSLNDTPLGLCSGSSIYDGAIEGNGWPCLDQVGRGGGPYKSQPSVPIYVWNNGPETGCSTGGTCSASMGIVLNCSEQSDFIKTTAHSNGDKDYCVGGTTMPASCGNHVNTYTPYTYPHLLQQAGGVDVTAPSPPKNLLVAP